MSDEKEILMKVYELITYLISSAQGLIIEPKSYGPFRCIDAVSRLIDVIDEIPCIPKDDYMHQLKEEIDTKKLLVLSDEEKFYEFIKELNVKLAKKIDEMIQ